MARDFDELLDETIVNTLGQVLGNEPAKALMFHMGAKASASGAKSFSGALERVTGSASVVVEKLIVKALFSRIGLKLEDNGGAFSFENSILRAQTFMIQGSKA
ncbi:MAG TPA: hypothetical protein VIW22_01565 [Nitrososphaerales archaeon]